MLEILKVTDPGDIASVARLASEIWNKHFVPIIGQQQVDYMLAKFQSAPAVAGQIADGVEYYLVMNHGRKAGYLAIIFSPVDSSAQLSKIYLKEEYRGAGHGSAMMAFVEERCRKTGIRELWLTVNRHNAGPIAFYRRHGFAKSEELVQDIGSGFVMDDYKMMRSITQQEDGKGRSLTRAPHRTVDTEK